MVRSWSPGSPRTINPPTAPQPKPSTESCIPVRPNGLKCIAVPPTAGTIRGPMESASQIVRCSSAAGSTKLTLQSSAAGKSAGAASRMDNNEIRALLPRLGQTQHDRACAVRGALAGAAALRRAWLRLQLLRRAPLPAARELDVVAGALRRRRRHAHQTAACRL